MYISKNFNNISYYIKSVTILHRGVISVTFITGEGELTPINAFTTLIVQYPTCKLHILCASLSPAQAFPPYCGLKQYNLLVQWHWFYSRTRSIHWNSLIRQLSVSLYTWGYHSAWSGAWPLPHSSGNRTTTGSTLTSPHSQGWGPAHQTTGTYPAYTTVM